MFRLDLLEKAFIIYYETPHKPWHDLIISPPIKNNPPTTFLPKKVFTPLMRSFFFWKNVDISNSTIPPFFFFFLNLRLRIIPGVIKVIFK